MKPFFGVDRSDPGATDRLQFFDVKRIHIPCGLRDHFPLPRGENLLRLVVDSLLTARSFTRILLGSDETSAYSRGTRPHSSSESRFQCRRPRLSFLPIRPPHCRALRAPVLFHSARRLFPSTHFREGSLATVSGNYAFSLPGQNQAPASGTTIVTQLQQDLPNTCRSEYCPLSISDADSHSLSRHHATSAVAFPPGLLHRLHRK